MSLVLGTALVRIQPSMAGFGAALTAGLSAQGKAIQKAGAAASFLVTAPIVGAIGAGISQAVSFESAFAGVKKTVDATDAEFAKLSQGIRDMAKEMPFAREEIASVVEAAGRFGVANEHLLSFSEVALQLGAATNLGPAAAAEQLTRLANVIGLPADQFDNLGAAIVALGNDFPTTEGEIAKFAQRLSGAASVIGASSADILGLSAGMASLGIRSEAGGTAMSRVMLNIQSAILNGGKDLQRFADVAGVSADEFTEKWRSDPTAAILSFISGVRRLNEEGANVPAILKAMGLGEIRVRDMLLRSSSGLDTMTRAVGLSNEAFGEGTALQEEYNKRLETTASQWVIFKNRVSDASMSLGQAFLPLLNQMLVSFTPLIDLIGLLAEGFRSLPAPLQAMIGFMTGVVVVAGPLAVILPRLFSGINMITAGIRGLMALASWQTVFAHPVLAIGLLIVALGTLTYVVVTNWDTIKAKTDEVLTKMGNGVNQFIDGPLQKIIEGWKSLPEWARFAWDGVVSAVRWAVDTIVGLIQKLMDAFNRIGPLDDWVRGAGGWFGRGIGGLVGAIPGFDSGGVMPGPRGRHSLAFVAGGETILPTHKQPIDDFTGRGSYIHNGPMVQISGPISIRSDSDITKLARELDRERQQAERARGRTYMNGGTW